MRITMHENSILNAIADCHPAKSSFAKLAKKTGMARNEVEEVVTGLKKIGYVNTTPKNEVYLKEDGRKYLGITSESAKSTRTTAATSLNKSVNNDLSALDKPMAQELEPQSFVGNEIAKPKHSVLASIDVLAIKLNKPVVEIKDCDLKGQALVKLAELMSDDIAELLLEIKSDLEQLAA